jgi:hypothetical protein
LSIDGYSLFTHHLINGLSGEFPGSINNDGNITTHSLSNYLIDQFKDFIHPPDPWWGISWERHPASPEDEHESFKVVGYNDDDSYALRQMFAYCINW